MENDFDRWNEMKKLIKDSVDEFAGFPQEGEAWMCALGMNIGFEQNGSGANFFRPVLIVRKFNNQMFWAVPLSTKQKDLDFYLNFTDPDGKRVSAILAQMKLVSIKRLKRKIYDAPNDVFPEVKSRLRRFLE